jgi:hypothetical protein
VHRYAIAGIFTVALSLPTAAQAQVRIVETEDVSISLSGRLQPQFNTSSADSVQSTFELRRARIGVDLLIDEWIEGRIEWNFAHTARLEDGYVNLAIDPRLELQVGQFKKPFSRLELTSSSRIVPIEAGLRIRGLDSNAEHHLLLDENVYIGREIGAQVHGQLGPLGYAAGIFNGSDQNSRDVNDAKSYAARLNLKPFEAPFEIGAGASLRDVALVDSLDETFTEEGLAIELDAQWGAFRRPGPFVLVEVMQAENFELDDPMIGASAILAWFQPIAGGRIEGIEPLLRGSYGDPSTEFEDNSGILLTPGVNLYFHGRNRLMLNWDYFVPELEALDPESALRAQLQLFF